MNHAPYNDIDCCPEWAEATVNPEYLNMSHKDAPPLQPSQKAFEAWVTKRGIRVGLGRDKEGNYFAPLARDLWACWQAGADHEQNL